MKLRTIKRRATARSLRWARIVARYSLDDEWAELDGRDEDDDMPDDVCLHCRGDGMDPDCDYLLPCPDCGEVM